MFYNNTRQKLPLQIGWATKCRLTLCGRVEEPVSIQIFLGYKRWLGLMRVGGLTTFGDPQVPHLCFMGFTSGWHMSLQVLEKKGSRISEVCGLVKQKISLEANTAIEMQ